MSAFPRSFRSPSVPFGARQLASRVGAASAPKTASAHEASRWRSILTKSPSLQKK